MSAVSRDVRSDVSASSYSARFLGSAAFEASQAAGFVSSLLSPEQNGTKQKSSCAEGAERAGISCRPGPDVALGCLFNSQLTLFVF